MLVKLRRFAKGDSKDYAPISPIRFLSSFRVKVDRFKRFANEDNNDLAPIVPI